MPTSYTTDPECNHVTRVFTFERGSEGPWRLCFNHEGAAKLSDEDRVEQLQQYQALAALSCFATQTDLDEARRRNMLPATRLEAWKLLDKSLSPCALPVPKPTAARALALGLAPIKAARKRRLSESDCDGPHSAAKTKAEIRWRLRQKLLMRRLDEERNTVSLAAMRLDNAVNESRAREGEEEKRGDWSVEDLLKEMAAAPDTNADGYELTCLTDEEAREIDLVCYETLKASEGSSVDEPVLIEDSDAGEDEGVGASTSGFDEREDGLLRDAVWYELGMDELVRRCNDAEAKRRTAARLLKAAHAAVMTQRRVMERANGKDAQLLWTYSAACEREDRLTQLQDRLCERKEKYAKAAEEADGARLVYNCRRERYDYDPARERLCADRDSLFCVKKRRLLVEQRPLY